MGMDDFHHTFTCVDVYITSSEFFFYFARFYTGDRKMIDLCAEK